MPRSVSGLSRCRSAHIGPAVEWRAAEDVRKERKQLHISYSVFRATEATPGWSGGVVSGHGAWSGSSYTATFRIGPITVPKRQHRPSGGVENCGECAERAEAAPHFIFGVPSYRSNTWVEWWSSQRPRSMKLERLHCHIPYRAHHGAEAPHWPSGGVESCGKCAERAEAAPHSIFGVLSYRSNTWVAWWSSQRPRSMKWEQ